MCGLQSEPHLEALRSYKGRIQARHRHSNWSGLASRTIKIYQQKIYQRSGRARVLLIARQASDVVSYQECFPEVDDLLDRRFSTTWIASYQERSAKRLATSRIRPGCPEQAVRSKKFPASGARDAAADTSRALTRRSVPGGHVDDALIQRQLLQAVMTMTGLH